MTTDNFSDALFEQGARGSEDYFSGITWVKMLVTNQPNYTIADVRFEKGARTNWHTHPAGQILMVTSGNGIYQEKGKPPQKIEKGSVINIPANIEHWHGATMQSTMIHIAVSNFEDKTNVTWLSPVTDEEYYNANQFEQI